MPHLKDDYGSYHFMYWFLCPAFLFLHLLLKFSFQILVSFTHICATCLPQELFVLHQSLSAWNSLRGVCVYACTCVPLKKKKDKMEQCAYCFSWEMNRFPAKWIPWCLWNACVMVQRPWLEVAKHQGYIKAWELALPQEGFKKCHESDPPPPGKCLGKCFGKHSCH